MGAPLDLVDRRGWAYGISRWLADGTRGTAVGVNANLVNLVRRDPKLAVILQRTEMVYADGKAVVWAGRILGWDLPERVATTDMIDPLCSIIVNQGASVFLFGGEAGVAEAAADQLQSRYPGLRIGGTHHGFVSSADEAEVIERINASQAQVLLVGLGDPLQQMWVARNRHSLNATVVLTCGGLFNWISGRHPRPPELIVAAGLEWAWRLALEPRRLARRYLVGNPAFLGSLAREKWAHRRKALRLGEQLLAEAEAKGWHDLLDIPEQGMSESGAPLLPHDEEALWS